MDNGIWKYLSAELKNNIKTQISADEGSTPLIQVNTPNSNINSLSIKLENLNPFGSFKDRSITYLLSYYYSKGERKFAISSSGNAGISAAGYANIINEMFDEKVELKIFISNQIPDSKFQRLQKIVNSQDLVVIIKSSKPKSDCIKFCNDSDFMNLRQSTDDKAIIGYETIVYENAEELNAIDSIFVCCSSGTSTVGIAKGLQNLDLKIPLHIVQTTKINPMASIFDNNFTKTETSSSSAISDRVAKRKAEVIDAVKTANGFGWVISDSEIQSGLQKVMQINDLMHYNFQYYSPEMGLVWAGMEKAIKNGFNINNPLLILSGY